MQFLLRKTIPTFVIALLFIANLPAQDAQELKAEREASARLKGEHPLISVMKIKTSALKKELEGVHPRVFVTQAEIDALKDKTKSQKDLWQTALNSVRALKVEPPPPPAETRRAQNEVGIGIAEAAFVYKITGDKKYLDAAKKYMDAAVSYDVWGYSYNKPNVDLAAGHLLYGMGWAYDLLYNDLTAAERDRYRGKLVKQAKLLNDFFKPKSGKSYAYSQNHTFIPISGLAITAYALMGEVPEAREWAATSRAVFDRVLATYSEDGYYYEGMEYWIFSTPWIAHYMDAHLHSTGEDLYKTTPGLKNAHKYVAHSTLPGGEFNFDFGDIYAGPITRSRKGDDYDRERINGKFRTNYNILFNLATRYGDGEIQGVADWLKSKGQANAEEFWTFIWYNPSIRSVPIEKQEKWHYFADHDVAYWRSSWNDDATAFAFKAGPPEGHGATEKINLFPEWRLSSGHAHPDAGSFIIWANGKYLTGDSGYAGVPMTAHHNTLLVDGKGQANEGKGHDAFNEFPYHQLDRVRIAEVKLAKNQVYIRGEADTTYQPKLGLTRFTRHFSFRPTTGFELKDELAANQASIFTTLLHADEKLEAVGKNRFLIRTPSASLEATIIEPTDFTAQIEPNILTAPGKPGSVDKGDRQQRGERLAVSNAKPSTFAQFLMKLKIVPASLR